MERVRGLRDALGRPRVEPLGLATIQSRYTTRWVQYYCQGVGDKPTDSHWVRFHDDLNCAFRGLCAYCEETTKGEVDHFRPKSKFPTLVYSWSNWLLACHECNHTKLNAWPNAGYVDPCATSNSERPECHFNFDTRTGLISPKECLSSRRRHVAQETIKALRLNDVHHLKKRVQWLLLFSSAMPEDPRALTTCTTKTLVHFASRGMQLSSIVRAWLAEYGFPPESLEFDQGVD